jgi:hypothetical protein
MLSDNSGGLGSRTRRLAAETFNMVRRVNHGGGAWRFRDQQLTQPQDGTPEAATNTEVKTQLGIALISEPEDARLTGGTRSLARRLLGLNIPSAKPAPAQPAKVAVAAHKAPPMPANLPVPIAAQTVKIPSTSAATALQSLPAAQQASDSAPARITAA